MTDKPARVVKTGLFNFQIEISPFLRYNEPVLWANHKQSAYEELQYRMAQKVSQTVVDGRAYFVRAIKPWEAQINPYVYIRSSLIILLQFLDDAEIGELVRHELPGEAFEEDRKIAIDEPMPLFMKLPNYHPYKGRIFVKVRFGSEDVAKRYF